MKTRKLWAARIGVLALAAVLLGVGMFRQEYFGVLQKAVTICLECIGIG